jgi:hypothetical protein
VVLLLKLYLWGCAFEEDEEADLGDVERGEDFGELPDLGETDLDRGGFGGFGEIFCGGGTIRTGATDTGIISLVGLNGRCPPEDPLLTELVSSALCFRSSSSMTDERGVALRAIRHWCL